MSKRNLEDLKMGLVEANFVCIDKRDKSLWLERGFAENRDYPIFLNELEDDETVMLGIPETIDGFGTDNLVDAKIIDVSTCLGTYGMGGPGFFGLSCDTAKGAFWLTFTVWGSGQYAVLDDRVIECHPQYNDQYNPWWSRNRDECKSIVIGAVIKQVELFDTECRIVIEAEDGGRHQVMIYKYSEKLPPMGNGKPRKAAFESGIITDYLLVTYEGTVLQV